MLEPARRLKIMKSITTIMLIMLLLFTTPFAFAQASRVDTPPKLDVVFVIDDTGSMRNEIAATQAEVISFKAELDAIADTRFGLVRFDDPALLTQLSAHTYYRWRKEYGGLRIEHLQICLQNVLGGRAPLA